MSLIRGIRLLNDRAVIALYLVIALSYVVS